MSPSRTVTDDRPVLRSVVGDADHFLGCVFGCRPWQYRRGAPPTVFGVDDVDRIVTSAVRIPAIRMIRGGARIPPHELCTPVRIGSTQVDDVADPRKVLDQLRRGATLVLQSLHRTWAPVSAWCAALEREVGWPVQANAYLTPPGERGLARHRDGHDVLAIQLHGSKSWDVEGMDGVELGIGDVLYLPAGAAHSAGTGPAPSLHLTVGIHRPTAERLARTAAAMAIGRMPPPAGAAPEETIDALLASLPTVDGAAVVDHLRRPPRVHAAGLLAAAVARPPVTGATRLAPCGTWTLGRDGDRVTVTWTDGVLSFPARAAAALRHLVGAAAPVEVDRLPGLDPEEQLVLARRLLDEAAAAAA